MKKEMLIELINECLCDMTNAATIPIAEEHESITDKKYNTAIRQIVDTLELLFEAREISEKKKYIARIKQACDIADSTLQSNITEDAFGTHDEIGAWRRLVITTTDKQKTLELLSNYEKVVKANFPEVKIKTIESPVKPDVIVCDMSGPKALALAKKTKEHLEKNSYITKVQIRDDVKLKPKN